MRPEEFDLIVLGAGAAGLTAATIGQGLGASVAIVERGRLGGECTWRGCVPSKTLLAAARACAAPAGLARLGLTARGATTIDTSGLMAHVRAVSAKVGEHDAAEVLEERGIHVVMGDARFVGPEELDVDGRRLHGRRFVIATGSRPSVPPIPGIDPASALTSDTLWDIDALPSSIAILGGGPVAVELASAFARLGVRTSVIVRSRLLRAEDPEMVERLSSVLESQGVEILSDAPVERVDHRGDGVVVTTKGRRIGAERLLVATGRVAVVPPGLEAIGVEVGERGVVTDSHMRTTARHVFAAGDVTGPHRFTHTAERAGIVAATNALLPVAPAVSWHDIVWVLFTDPELAHLGMTEDQARAAHGDRVEVLRYEFAEQDRARAEGVVTGLAKYVLDHRGHLLGAQILGERAGELIHEASILLHNDMPFSSLSSVMHAYPTFADAVKRPADLAYADRLRGNPLVRGALGVLVGTHDPGERG